jgi:tRNA A-37 threonylcarbamoyl transferase component Bud32
MLKNIKKYKIEKRKYLYMESKSDLITFLEEYVKNNESLKNIELIQENEERKVYKFIYKESTYYLKHYLNSEKSQKLKNKLREKEGIRSFRKLVNLQDKNINVVKPALAMSSDTGESYCITEELAGLDLKDFLLKENNVEQRKKVLDSFADEFTKILKAKYYHGDCHLRNFLVSAEKVYTVDVDSIKKHVFMNKIILRKNLIRLIRAIDDKDKVHNLKDDERDKVMTKILEKMSIKNIDDEMEIFKSNLESRDKTSGV